LALIFFSVESEIASTLVKNEKKNQTMNRKPHSISIRKKIVGLKMAKKEDSDGRIGKCKITILNIDSGPKEYGSA
jgi:hypothetical protein